MAFTKQCSILTYLCNIVFHDSILQLLWSKCHTLWRFIQDILVCYICLKSSNTRTNPAMYKWQFSDLYHNLECWVRKVTVDIKSPQTKPLINYWANRHVWAVSDQYTPWTSRASVFDKLLSKFPVCKCQVTFSWEVEYICMLIAHSE